MKLVKLVFVAVALAAAVALLAACGSSSSSSSSSGPDPATLVPANVPLYADAVVKPEGDQKDSVDSFLEKLTGRSDVGSLLVQKLDQGLASNQDNITYEDDIQPWLGSDVGFFLTSFGNNPDGAVIAPTSDGDAAMAAVEKTIKSSDNVHDATYKGVSYQTQTTGSSPSSAGIVDGFLVAGTPDAFKAVVDASQGASSLADSGDYKSALASAPDSPLFTAFVDPKAILQAALAESGTTPGGAMVLKQLEGSTQGPIAGWLDATSTSAALTFSAPKPADGAAPSGDGSLVSGLPQDSWLAFGAADVGSQLSQGFSTAFQRGLAHGFSTSGLGGVTPANALKRFAALTGIDFTAIGKWLTSVSGYVSGSSVFSLSGALVLGTSDEKASAQSLSEFQRLLAKDANVSVSPLGGGETGFKIVPKGTPVEIDVEQANGKVVIGLGQGSVQNALSPSSKLSDSDTFKTATANLGDGVSPSFYLDFQPIARFVSTAAASSPDPRLQLVQPYLDRLDYLVAGAGTTGDRVESQIVLGVHASQDSSTGTESSVLP